MTDLERLTALLDDYGVKKYQVTADKEKALRIVSIGEPFGMEDPKVTGYMMFVSVFVFDETGKFLEVGAWE